tara:strand:- start:1064 stop:1624 length:561 start_codon:yes stop_codon:yes gene_type:complete
MRDYEDSAGFNYQNADDRGQVQLGFEALLLEMREYLRRAELSDEYRASEDQIQQDRNARIKACEEIGVEPEFDSSSAGLRAEVLEATDELIELSGLRIKRVDEINALMTKFEGTGKVPEDAVDEAMLLFRQLTLRSVIQMTSEDYHDVKGASQRAYTYGAAYAALSTADPGSEIWYPFDEFVAKPL